MRSSVAGALRGIELQIVGWILAIVLFMLVRFVGLGTVDAFRELDLSLIDYPLIFAQGVAAGAAVGLAFGLLDLGFARTRLSQQPYGKLILLQSAAHVLIIVATLAAVRAAGFFLQGETFDAREWIARVASTNLVVVLIYTGVVSVLFNFLKQVNRKFGPGNLGKMLLGRYYRPREEKRVFMFLDLQASTTLAEALGHVRYSRLIQDCFRDLAVVLRNRAEVYQYVGDEAVLCWEMEPGLEQTNCLSAFFGFDDQIRSRKEDYLREYGVVPTFKAGVNSGLVTVAEVGEIKREIAFHGDVLNTAARIQSKCNELGKRLLISEYLKQEIGEQQAFRFEAMGTVELRGRTQSVAIYAVEPIGSPA